MAPRRKGEVRQRHGTRQLILKVFDEPGSTASLSTSAISDRVSKAAGTKIPEFSVYGALRTLVKRKELKATRDGHEKVYSIAARRGRPPRAPAPSSPVRSELVGVPRSEDSPPPAGPVRILPHKLAVGEALILHVGEEHIESVTNVHGRLVVAKHRRGGAAE